MFENDKNWKGRKFTPGLVGMYFEAYEEGIIVDPEKFTEGKTITIGRGQIVMKVSDGVYYVELFPLIEDAVPGEEIPSNKGYLMELAEMMDWTFFKVMPKQEKENNKK